MDRKASESSSSLAEKILDDEGNQARVVGPANSLQELPPLVLVQGLVSDQELEGRVLAFSEIRPVLEGVEGEGFTGDEAFIDRSWVVRSGFLGLLLMVEPEFQPVPDVRKGFLRIP